MAFAVRVLYMTLAHTFKFRNLDDHFQFGWEAGRIAQALVTGFGYADPFSNAVLKHSGPTAWLPPIYPLLIAGVFKVFGLYSYLSAWVLLTINSAFSALTAMWIWELGARVFSRRCGLWAGWIWALYPAAMQYAVRWVWEMTLTTALFTFAILLAVRMVQDSKSLTRQWLLLGAVWAAIALSNASLLLCLPFAGLWVLMKTWSRPRALSSAVLAGLFFLGCLVPWEIRNYKAFHTFIPIRGNLGVELYLGNGPGSTGWLMAFDHPFLSPIEIEHYRSMGEVAYVKMRGDLAKQYIAAHPDHFLAVTGKRVYFFWAGVPHPTDNAWYVELGRTVNFGLISIIGLMGLGLMLYRRVPGGWLFFYAFLTLPVPYYVVTVHARFRHPLEPLICVLGVYLFQSVEPRRAKV